MGTEMQQPSVKECERDELDGVALSLDEGAARARSRRRSDACLLATAALAAAAIAAGAAIGNSASPPAARAMPPPVPPAPYANAGLRRLGAPAPRLPALERLRARVNLTALWEHGPSQGTPTLDLRTCSRDILPASLRRDRVDWYTHGEAPGAWLRRYDPAAPRRPVCMGRTRAERRAFYDRLFSSPCSRPSMVWTDADANASTFQTGMFDPAPALLGLDPMILDVCRTLAGDEARAPLCDLVDACALYDAFPDAPGCTDLVFQGIDVAGVESLHDLPRRTAVALEKALPPAPELPSSAKAHNCLGEIALELARRFAR